MQCQHHYVILIIYVYMYMHIVRCVQICLGCRHLLDTCMICRSYTSKHSSNERWVCMNVAVKQPMDTRRKLRLDDPLQDITP